MQNLNKQIGFCTVRRISFMVKSSRGSANTSRISEPIRPSGTRRSTQLSHPPREVESAPGRLPRDSAREAPIESHLQNPADRLDVPSVVEDLGNASANRLQPSDEEMIKRNFEESQAEALAEAARALAKAQAKAQADPVPADISSHPISLLPCHPIEMPPCHPIEISDSESDFSDSEFVFPDSDSVSNWEVDLAFDGGSNGSSGGDGGSGPLFGGGDENNFWFSEHFKVVLLGFSFGLVYLLLKKISNEIAKSTKKIAFQAEKIRNSRLFFPKNRKQLGFWKRHQAGILEFGAILAALAGGPHAVAIVVRNLSNPVARALVRFFNPFFKIVGGFLFFYHGLFIFFRSIIFASKLGFTFENGLFNSLLQRYSFIFSTVALDPKVSFVEFLSKSIVLSASSGLIFQFLFQIKIKKDKNSICVSVIFVFAFSFIIYFVFQDSSYFRSLSSHLLKDSLFSELVGCQLGRGIIVISTIFLSRELQIFFPNMGFIFVCLLYFYQLFPMIFKISSNILP